MYQLKNGTQIVAESSKPIEYHDDQNAWFVIFDTHTTWYVNTPKTWTVEQVADPVVHTDGGPDVIG
jgi:hypothetical protein